LKNRSGGQPTAHGMRVKKEHGQNFLRDERVLHEITQAVNLDQSNVLEIGCGDGVLTRVLLENKINKLLVYEIDPEWAKYVKNILVDDRLTILQENFLDADLQKSLVALNAVKQKWVVAANLPYHVTFPILRKFLSVQNILSEGVIMVQEEVAQKIVANAGRSYGYISLYFQYFFDWKLLSKVAPTAFYPAPKVFSRLLHFTPRVDQPEIANLDDFWNFIKAAFSQPRRMLRNCLSSYHYDLTKIDDDFLAKRAQQLKPAELLAIWQKLN
jgi:16S rRNA (adenine1518-N6/adenine1519-N6)-dimethyltransferase